MTPPGEEMKLVERLRHVAVSGGVNSRRSALLTKSADLIEQLVGDRDRAVEVLRPFVEAAANAEISGRPPFEFCGADDYIRSPRLPRLSGGEMSAPADKISYTVAEGAAALGIGRSTLYEMLAEGVLQAKRLRGRTLIPRSELERIIAEAPDARQAKAA